MCTREVLRKYLEVPPLQVQELGAPDVVPCEDVLILTETEVLQPGSNLLCPPEVNCRRRRSTSAVSAPSPVPGRRCPRRPGSQHPERPSTPDTPAASPPDAPVVSPRDAPAASTPDAPAASTPAADTCHPGAGAALSSAESGKEPPALEGVSAAGAGHLLPGRPSAFPTFPRVPGGTSTQPDGNVGLTAVQPLSLHLLELNHFRKQQEGSTQQFMASEPPSLKETQFLDKREKEKSRELPRGGPTPPQIQAWGHPAPGSAGDSCAQGQPFR